MQRRLAELRAAPRFDVAAPLDWLRRRLTSTPGRIALAAVLLVAATVVFGVVAAAVERSREDAARAVAGQTEPLLVQAVSLYAALSDADATATTTFLTRGLEPLTARRRYIADLHSASRSLAFLAAHAGDSGRGHAAVSLIAQELPIYSGLVESARANNRIGYPLGAAYLRQASSLLRDQILPAARSLYRTEAEHLDSGYRAATAPATLTVFLLAIAVLALPLVLVQLYLAQATRRFFNVPLAIATAVLLAVWIWGAVALVREQHSLVHAQRDGSDAVELLSAVRILASRAQSDESLALVARGGGDAYLDDFDAATRGLTGNGHASLVDATKTLASRSRTNDSLLVFTPMLRAYLRAHARTIALENDNHFSDAIRYAIAHETPSEDGLQWTLKREVASAQRRFADRSGDATNALAGVSFALPIAVVVCAVLSLVGLQQRLREYR